MVKPNLIFKSTKFYARPVQEKLRGKTVLFILLLRALVLGRLSLDTDSTLSLDESSQRIFAVAISEL